MRLIDADKIYNDLIDNIDYLRNQNYGLYSSVGDTIRFVIEQQPTAYDIDKVVEQLKNASYERFGNTGMGGENVVNLDDAIEMAKAGSKNDD